MAKPTGRPWILLLLLLCGIVIGSFLGHLTKDISWLSWLDYGLSFGIGSEAGNGALLINLSALTLTFGLTVRITIASILGVILAVFVYRKI